MALVARFRGLVQERLTLLRLLPAVRRANLGWLAATHLGTALSPTLAALTTAWLVMAVVRAGVAPVLPLVTVIGVFVLSGFAESAKDAADSAAARDIDRMIRSAVRILAARPAGIAHLEDPEFQNDLHLASPAIGSGGHGHSAGFAVVGQATLISRIVGALAAAAVVAWYSSLLALGLLAASLVIRARVRRQWMGLSEAYTARASETRRAQYWKETAGGADGAKEIRMFGLGAWLTGRAEQAALDVLTDIWRLRGTVLRRQGMTIALATASGFAAIGVPALLMRHGLPAADVVACMVAALAVLNISTMGAEPFDIEYGSARVRAFRRLQAYVADREPHGPAPSGMPVVTTPRLAFENVTFAYPGGPPVLDGFDLRIAPGEVLGVVGLNGAGKTTLVKLLAGLHRPTHGRITADGVDLASLDSAAWRRRISAVFQDFARYPATVHENVALAAPEFLNDRAGAAEALRAAGADGFAESLEQGTDTALWKGIDGGAEISGGQWQKLAVARLLFAARHGRDILVLDEPTAHLDIRAEIDFHDTVIAGVAGASVLLISHRLSTVRRADRIVLLAGGRVAESGTHEQLLALDGEYARLFRLQASHFDLLLEDSP